MLNRLFKDSQEREVEKTLCAMQNPVFSALSVLLEASVPQDATFGKFKEKPLASVQNLMSSAKDQ